MSVFQDIRYGHIIDKTKYSILYRHLKVKSAIFAKNKLSGMMDMQQQFRFGCQKGDFDLPYGICFSEYSNASA